MCIERDAAPVSNSLIIYEFTVFSPFKNMLQIFVSEFGMPLHHRATVGRMKT